MKNCEYYQKAISDFHDDGMELSVEVREHIKECPHCEGFYRLLQSQSRLLGALPDAQKQMALGNKKSIVRKVWETKLTIPLPAAAILLLFFGMYLLSTIGQTRLQRADEGQWDDLRTPSIQIVKLAPQTAIVASN